MRAEPVLPSGFTLIEMDSVGSTNEEARSLADSGAADGTLVWARDQTAGRGRRGRVWLSPRGNLYCSMVLRPEVPAAEAAQLSFVAALALGDALGGFVDPAHIGFKWPNDVQVKGAKIAGILLESSGVAAAHVEWLVVGCGVNVLLHPAGVDRPATDLRAEGAADATVEAVLEAYTRHFDGWRERWRQDGIAPVRAAWLARAVGIGEAITVRLPETELHGKFVDMDETGALILDLADGGRRTISAGDVFLATELDHAARY